MTSQSVTSSLPCGCVIGYFNCAGLQRIQSLEKNAYWRESWKEYEELNHQKWHHLGLKSPFYEKG